MNKIYLPDRAPSLMVSHYFRFPFLLLFFVLMYVTTGAQVNAYARVTGINAAKTTLDITHLNQTHGSFAASRQVIVLQMQDDVIANTGNNAGFGTLGTIGQAGLFEVATIQSFNSSQITLTAPLRKNYNTGPNSRVQVVSFNQLGNPDFTTNENMTAVPWNGNTGGVIAFQVNGVLQLRHSITADGAGFRGGSASNNDNLDCNDNQYITGSTDYGQKGEGIYRINNNNAFEHGRARILTGGGGGAGFNGGGAGGGNYTAGGNGGPGWQCSNATGGLGGIALNTHMMTGNRLFMGGGGGGGQGNNNEQTEGGNGGGIIIIKANSITGSFLNFERISANGESSRNTRGGGNDGAGGAGAGGTILLQVSNYNVQFLSHLLIQANGGNGGNVESFIQHGGGGGGGQGAILLSGAAPGSNITINTLNGEGGLNSQFFGASRAGSGAGVNNVGIVPGVSTSLPVRLLYFAAAMHDTKTRLTWTATDELNTLFHVQHSIDGTHYTTIGTVKGNGNGTAINNYSFTHHVPASGNNYYRLEMTEEPDFKLYSSIARVNFNDLPAIPVAYPNPARDHFSLRLTDINNNTRYAVRIADLAGKIVYTGSHQPVNNIITVHTGNKLVPGVYMVTVNTATRTHLVKLVIQ
jgi:hypothetical protein